MRVVLLCQASTEATRRAAFAADEPAEPASLATAAGLATALPRTEQVRRGPSRCCRQTAEALGLGAASVPDVGLAGCDFGRWTGRGLDEVVAQTPDEVTRWLTDPAANPHGGESLRTLLTRVGRWLDGLDAAGTRSLLAVADQSVIRAAVVYALDARPRSFWRIDAPPLSQTVLTGGPGRWSWRAPTPR